MAIKKAARKVVRKAAAGKPATKSARKVAQRPPAGKSAKAGQVPSGTGKAKKYSGSCHCGRIAFEVEGVIDQVVECNCSMCRRRGGLLWFVPRDALRLATPEGNLSTYTFNKHVLLHHFCSHCGVAPFSEGEKKGAKMAAINARCLEGVEPSVLKVVKYDGRKA